MPNCFVIMPFRPELAYLYRTVKQHLAEHFPEVTVERGDDATRTGQILAKIHAYIRQADVVIADCTGRNANVFYELGMAHALDKPVVLITAEAADQVPTDIRAYELISYGMLGPDEFFAKLVDAIGSVVGSPFAEIYPEACQRFEEFCSAHGRDLQPVSRGTFEAAMAGGRRLPRRDEKRRAELLIRRLLPSDTEIDIDIFIELRGWLDETFPSPPNTG